MNITPIRNEKDYQEAFGRLHLIFDAKKGRLKGDELEILSILSDLSAPSLRRRIFGCSISGIF